MARVHEMVGVGDKEKREETMARADLLQPRSFRHRRFTSPGTDQTGTRQLSRSRVDWPHGV